MTSLRLDGRVAVVTGGANGIGLASVKRLVAEGASVVIADVQFDKAEAAAAEICGAGGKAVAVRVDAASVADNHAMAEAAIEHFGRLDILLTAAGISHSEYRSGDLESDVKNFMKSAQAGEVPGRRFIELPVEDWQKVIDVNLTGTLVAMQACAEKMIEAGNGGTIITIASVAAKHPDAGPIAYTVSKAGVWMLTKKAARELAGAKIRVNAIGPGFIDTSMTKALDFDDTRRSALFTNIPMGRKGQPEEVAAVVAFLASDDASYMTGTILHPTVAISPTDLCSVGPATGVVRSWRGYKLVW